MIFQALTRVGWYNKHPWLAHEFYFPLIPLIFCPNCIYCLSIIWYRQPFNLEVMNYCTCNIWKNSCKMIVTRMSASIIHFGGHELLHMYHLEEFMHNDSDKDVWKNSCIKIVTRINGNEYSKLWSVKHKV